MSSLRFLLRRGVVYIVPLAVLLLALGARVAAPELLDRLMLISFDLYQRIAPRPAGDGAVRIVDIDNASLKQYGQWPWPRGLDAQLIDKLHEAGAAVVALDIVFSEPDRTSPDLLLAELQRRGGVDAETARLLSALPDPDAQLAAAIKSVPTVAGFILVDQGGGTPPMTKAGFGAAGNEPLRDVESFPAAIGDLPVLQQAAAGNGFLNRHVDWDDIVRRVPLIMRLGQKPVFSLVAETLRVVTGAHTYLAKAAGANGETSFGRNTGLTQVKIGPLTLPTDAAGRVWVYYAPFDTKEVISAAKILSGDFDPAFFKGRIVLVGTSANGVVNDTQSTPLAAHVPGVAIHAQLIEQILAGIFLVRPDWAQGAELVFALVIGLALIFVLPRIGAIASAVIGGVAVAVAVGGSWAAFRYAHLLIDPVYPWLAVTLVYLTGSVLGYLRTEIRQREIR
ncbi:MAG TPA: CHASE2 domain-containing protein, partial [Stellaceae bacterium]|nr:CHASE2 domain-containing protein [Stellaceae bacterium]